MFTLLYRTFLTLCASGRGRLFLHIHQFNRIVNIHLLYQYWCRNLNLKYFRVCFIPPFYFRHHCLSFLFFSIFGLLFQLLYFPSFRISKILFYFYLFLNTCFLTAVRSFIHIFGI